MIDGLRNHSQIKLIHNRWSPTVAGSLAVKVMRAHVKELYGEELSEEIILLSEVASNTHICWQAEIIGKKVGGEFFLKSLDILYNTTFSGHQVIKSFGPKIPSPKEISIVEDHPEFGDGQFVLLHRKNAKSKTALWFYQNGYVYPMNLTYREYLGKLCETRGIAWWQLFFCDFKDDIDNLELHKMRMKSIFEAMTILFPNTDYTYYREVLAKL